MSLTTIFTSYLLASLLLFKPARHHSLYFFTMQTSTQTLFLCFLLLGLTKSGMGLALPGESIPTGISRRADTDFYTMYGIYDPSPQVDHLGDHGGTPKLAPIPDVFEAMKQAGNTAEGATPSLRGASMTSTALGGAQPTPSRFFNGPGLVVLASSVNNALVSATSTSTPKDVTSVLVPSNRLVILGSVVGGIMFVALGLLLLLDPGFSGRICICSRNKRISKPERKKPEKEGAADTKSWVTLTAFTPKRGSLETIKEASRSADDYRESIIDITAVLSDSPSSAPPSKFSICSSQYPASTRDSQAPSESDSNTSTLKGNDITEATIGPRAQSKSATSGPVRPPRPPTADSPALSDSVYLACSDQPYVTVAHQLFTEVDQEESIDRRPRSILTPDEFLALAEYLKDRDVSSSSAISANLTTTPINSTTTVKRGSSEANHSRTKSEPALGGSPKKTTTGKIPLASRQSCVSTSARRVTFSQNLEAPKTSDGAREVLDVGLVNGSIAQKVLQHRRSRSASGWAYPSHGRKTRKTFRLED